MATKHDTELVLSETEALNLISMLSAALYNRRTGHHRLGDLGCVGTGQSFGDLPTLEVDGATFYFVIDMAKDPVKEFLPFPTDQT